MSEDLSNVELLFYNLGLDTPFARFVAGFMVSEGLVMAAKPPFAFDEQGEPRGWSLLNGGDNGTMIPWWLPGLVVGSALATLI